MSCHLPLLPCQSPLEPKPRQSILSRLPPHLPLDKIRSYSSGKSTPSTQEPSECGSRSSSQSRGTFPTTAQTSRPSSPESNPAFLARPPSTPKMGMASPRYARIPSTPRSTAPSPRSAKALVATRMDLVELTKTALGAPSTPSTPRASMASPRRSFTSSLMQEEDLLSRAKAQLAKSKEFRPSNEQPDDEDLRPPPQSEEGSKAGMRSFQREPRDWQRIEVSDDESDTDSNNDAGPAADATLQIVTPIRPLVLNYEREPLTHDKALEADEVSEELLQDEVQKAPPANDCHCVEDCNVGDDVENSMLSAKKVEDEILQLHVNKFSARLLDAKKQILQLHVDRMIAAESPGNEVSGVDSGCTRASDCGSDCDSELESEAQANEYDGSDFESEVGSDSEGEVEAENEADDSLCSPQSQAEDSYSRHQSQVESMPQVADEAMQSSPDHEAEESTSTPAGSSLSRRMSIGPGKVSRIVASEKQDSVYSPMSQAESRVQAGHKAEDSLCGPKGRAELMIQAEHDSEDSLTSPMSQAESRAQVEHAAESSWCSPEGQAELMIQAEHEAEDSLTSPESQAESRAQAEHEAEDALCSQEGQAELMTQAEHEAEDSLTSPERQAESRVQAEHEAEDSLCIPERQAESMAQAEHEAEDSLRSRESQVESLPQAVNKAKESTGNMFNQDFLPIGQSQSEDQNVRKHANDKLAPEAQFECGLEKSLSAEDCDVALSGPEARISKATQRPEANASNLQAASPQHLEEKKAPIDDYAWALRALGIEPKVIGSDVRFNAKDVTEGSESPSAGKYKGYAEVDNGTASMVDFDTKYVPKELEFPFLEDHQANADVVKVAAGFDTKDVSEESQKKPRKNFKHRLRSRVAERFVTSAQEVSAAVAPAGVKALECDDESVKAPVDVKCDVSSPGARLLNMIEDQQAKTSKLQVANPQLVDEKVAMDDYDWALRALGTEPKVDDLKISGAAAPIDAKEPELKEAQEGKSHDNGLNVECNQNLLVVEEKELEFVCTCIDIASSPVSFEGDEDVALFNRYDANRSGRLEAHEYQRFFEDAGFMPQTYEEQDVIRKKLEYVRGGSLGPLCLCQFSQLWRLLQTDAWVGDLDSDSEDDILH